MNTPLAMLTDLIALLAAFFVCDAVARHGSAHGAWPLPAWCLAAVPAVLVLAFWARGRRGATERRIVEAVGIAAAAGAAVWVLCALFVTDPGAMSPRWAAAFAVVAAALLMCARIATPALHGLWARRSVAVQHPGAPWKSRTLVSRFDGSRSNSADTGGDDRGSGDCPEQGALSRGQLMAKGIFDRVAACVLVVIILPVLLLVSLAIAVDTRGPVFFSQPRTGFGGRSFKCLKFRTMRHDMADLLTEKQTERNDPRVTRVGRVLRKTSIDELPQLFNVLRGEMSLVGPRPHAPQTKAAGRLFRDVVPHYEDRHRVKPGITGWAQVNGWRGETVTERDIAERVRHDLDYIANWSFMLDLKIIVLTVVRSLRDAKAY